MRQVFSILVLLLCIGLLPRQANAQSADVGCQDTSFVLLIDASYHSFASADGLPGSLDEMLLTAQHAVGRLQVDKVVRCPNNTYSVGVYLYGGQMLAVIPYELGNIQSLDYSSPTWTTELTASVREKVTTIGSANTSALHTATSDVAMTAAFEAIRSAVGTEALTRTYLMILSSGYENSAPAAAANRYLSLSDFSNTTVRIYEAQSQGLGINSADTIQVNPSDLVVQVDNWMDETGLITMTTPFRGTCGTPLELPAYRDRLMLELNGAEDLSHYSVNVDGQPLLTNGRALTNTIEIIQTMPETHRYWLVMKQPPGGSWVVSTQESCTVSIVAPEIDDAGHDATLTGALPVYGEVPFYIPDSQTRLTVDLRYSDNSPVVPLDDDPLNVVGTIRQSEQIEGTVNFTFDRETSLWRSDTPPPAQRPGSYTVQLTGMQTRGSAQSSVFTSAGRVYTVADVGTVRVLFEPLTVGTSSDTPLDIHVLATDTNSEINNAIRVRARLQLVSAAESDPLIAATAVFAPGGEDNPLRVQLYYDNRVLGSTVTLVETATPGLLEAEVTLPEVPSFLDDETYPVEVRLTTNNAHLTGDYVILDSTLSQAQTLYVNNNTETKTQVVANIISPTIPTSSTAATSYTLFAPFPGSCSFIPSLTQVATMPLQIQLVDVATNDPIVFEEFTEAGTAVTSFVTGSLATTTADGSPVSAAVPLQVDSENLSLITADLAPIVQQMSQEDGQYTLTLVFTAAPVGAEYVFRSDQDGLVNGQVAVPFTVELGAITSLSNPMTCRVAAGMGVYVIAWLLLSVIYNVALRLTGQVVIESSEGNITLPINLRALNRLPLFIFFPSQRVHVNTPQLASADIRAVDVFRWSLLSRKGVRTKFYRHDRHLLLDKNLTHGDSQLVTTRPNVRVTYHDEEGEAIRADDRRRPNTTTDVPQELQPRPERVRAQLRSEMNRHQEDDSSAPRPTASRAPLRSQMPPPVDEEAPPLRPLQRPASPPRRSADTEPPDSPTRGKDVGMFDED